jgi:asparagine synthetase B (glutamine-hydrolysing)
MQILFGVLGHAARSAEVFDQLAAASMDSNPGVALSIEAKPDVRLGHVSRSFAAWHDLDADLSLFLDGEIRTIDGRETMNRGVAHEDMEALSRLYLAHGPSMWERLDGSFCLVVRDGSRFRIGVDVAGTRAVYWWVHDGLLAFDSHLIDLAPSYPGTLTEDAGALGNYLECGQYPPGATAYRQIHHLGAGKCLSLDDGEVRVGSHLRMVYAATHDTAPTNRLVDELIDLVSAAIGRCWRAARKPVVPLSGGVDSRYLAGELIRQAGGPDTVRTITWGEDRSRVDADAAIAARVASALKVKNTWCEKPQRLTADVFERAIYLSSGEADCAIHYPEDHLLHADLAETFGFASLFRGDEYFGWSRPQLLTGRAVLASGLIARLALDDGYAAFIGPETLKPMAREQAATLEIAVKAARSRTPEGRREEISYGYGLARELAPYNTVKHTDLEVYTPFLDRQIVEWTQGTPDRLRSGKALFRMALDRRFPELAAIPFATRSNLPDWGLRWRRDPSMSRFYREWCARPGWLDTIGATTSVLAALEAAEAAATAANGAPNLVLAPVHPGVGPRWRELAKRTVPGRLYRELTLERRYARNNLPPYLRFARLAVLHGLLGRIQQRRSSQAPVVHRTDGAGGRR